MVKAGLPAKPKYPRLVWAAYVYAAILIAVAVAALMGMGGFDFAFITYTTPGLPVMTVTIAGLMIFSLPFLLGLPLSPLARFFSALFTVAAPAANFLYVLYLMMENAVAFDAFLLAGAAALIGLAAISFAVLGGSAALRFSKG